MAALVRADAAETARALQVVDVLLNRTPRNPQRRDKPRLRQVRMVFQQLPQALGGFLTAFSDRLSVSARPAFSVASCVWLRPIRK